MKRKIFGGLVTVAIVGGLIYMVFQIGLDTITDREALTEYIQQFGVYAPIVFFLIQFLQVIFAPIPGNITGLVGGAVFGLWVGFLLNALAVVLGSIVMFYLGKRYGRKITHRFMDDETYEKYANKISGKAGRGVLMGLFLIPFAPDDVICLIAGISKIEYKNFILILLVGRVPSSLITSAVGTGFYQGNIGLVVALSLVYYAIAFLVYWKYDKIKAFANKHHTK